ncbi:MAG: transglutaminase domain-containing protein, partial [Bacteroidales bacterium]|nr:transglutaminase domain-containing protein [Bacteroidales bacterium]
MKIRLIISLLACFICFCSCHRETHFITDADYRAQVEKDFEARKVLAEGRAKELFSVLDSNLSTEEREAMQFLYAYMPYSDLADYDGDFFLKQVRYAFAARDTFAWGRTVPEDIFRHF